MRTLMQTMPRTLLRSFTLLFLASVLTGCAVHARVYDPYYHDYHGWGGETVYYNQWEHDTHRNHEDFNKRSDADKKAYWDWRHSHPEQH